MAWRIALALFAITLATRLPFQTEHLWAHDSVLYARAIAAFDPPAHQPQPPGYLFYVLLLRAVDAVVADPNRAMTLVSAVAAAVAVALLYLLAARLYDERTGRIAALFLLTAVTFWGEGAVAYPYTLLAALTTAVALLLWRAFDRREDPGPSPSQRGRRLLVASAAWGVAIGLRSDLAIVLAPLWLLAAAGTAAAWAALSALAVTALVAVWLAATSALTPGGASAFLAAVGEQAAFVDERYGIGGQGPEAIARNGRELARFLWRGLYALIPLLGALVVSADIRRIESRERRRLAFLLLWTAAPLPLYLLVHVGEYGYVFSMLPGLCVLSARGAIGIVRGARVPGLLPWVVGAVAIANAVVFLFSDSPLAARDLERRDRGIAEKVAYLRAHLDPSAAVIVTAYEQLTIEHYLAGYALSAYEPDATPELERRVECPRPSACPSRITLVVWDELLRPSGEGWTMVRFPSGSRLAVAERSPGSSLRVRDGVRLELGP